jgi:hypothetical protein
LLITALFLSVSDMACFGLCLFVTAFEENMQLADRALPGFFRLFRFSPRLHSYSVITRLAFRTNVTD